MKVGILCLRGRTIDDMFSPSLSIFTFLSSALIASKRDAEAWNGRWNMAVMAHTDDGEQLCGWVSFTVKYFQPAKTKDIWSHLNKTSTNIPKYCSRKTRASKASLKGTTIQKYNDEARGIGKGAPPARAPNERRQISDWWSWGNGTGRKERERNAAGREAENRSLVRCSINAWDAEAEWSERWKNK